jgi:hypothetical protein
MKALRLPAHASPVTYLFRFRAPRYPPSFVSRGLRSQKGGGRLPGQDHCSAGDPISGVPSRGRERDLSGSQATRPVPLPRSGTPAEPTFPSPIVVSSMLPPRRRRRRLQRDVNIGATARLQHLLSTLHERCCHRPCKTRFRLAGWPLPGGSRTLWIALKGFRASTFSFPFPGFILTLRRRYPASQSYGPLRLPVRPSPVGDVRVAIPTPWTSLVAHQPVSGMPPPLPRWTGWVPLSILPQPWEPSPK